MKGEGLFVGQAGYKDKITKFIKLNTTIFCSTSD